MEELQTLPWSVQFILIDNIKRHPSQLYEAFYEGMYLFYIEIFFLINNYLNSINIRFIFSFLLII